MDLVDRMLAGDRLALSKLITMVENRSGELPRVMERIYPHTGRAFTIGITGPPGAGKSTIVDKLARRFRDMDKTVGIVAVDPSSPFSGGALLGDRIRMSQHATDTGVFIRSLGSRGSHGGLSRATKEVALLYDAFGKDFVIVETVGVGQTELDIMGLADTTVVVFVPESGDTIQTMKAGLTEIADVFVVNKSDRDGADKIYREIKLMVEMGLKRDGGWQIPVISTVANMGEGMEDLEKAILEHRESLKLRVRPPEEKAGIIKEELTELLAELFRERVDRDLDGLFERHQAALLNGKTNPYSVALHLLDSGELYDWLWRASGGADKNGGEK